MFIDIRKAIPNSTSGVEECPLKKFPFLCKESQQCLYKAFVCDGHIQCDKGEDESLELCKERGVFAKEANFQCDAKSYGATNLTMRILSFRCNGIAECQGNIDENDCDTDTKYMIILLKVGFVVISLAAVFVCIVCNCFVRSRNVAKKGVELENLIQAPSTEEEWHADESRGHQIAFAQGSKHRIQKNQALVSAETEFHGNLPEAILCINVSNLLFM